jgi:hypothetical protein
MKFKVQAYISLFTLLCYEKFTILFLIYFKKHKTTLIMLIIYM